MSNVVQLAPPAKSTVVEELRQLADEIERGDYSEVRVGLVLLDTQAALHRRIVGPSTSLYECIGMLESAKVGCVDDLFGD